MAATDGDGGGKGTGKGDNNSRADSYVPTFKQQDYREYRKRCAIYRKRMELAGRSKETAFNIITMLTGKAWDLVEDLDMERLAEDGGYDMIFERLDRGFKQARATDRAAGRL